MIKKLNLQLFANDVADDEDLDFFENDIDETISDDEIEDEEFIEDDEDEEAEEAEETEETEEAEETEEDEELEEQGEPQEDKKIKKPDKVTKALIKAKKEKKELKRQLEQALARLREIETQEERSKMIAELVESGKSQSEAEQIVNAKLEAKQLKTKLVAMELEKLENKYPGISAYASKLVEDKEQFPDFSYEQIYLAKYYKANEYDTMTKLEQEMLYKAQQKKKKALGGSTPTKSKSVKLSPADERAYRALKKSMPNITRKRYLELISKETLDE